MSFGTTGGLIAISGLAIRVHIAYKDAPDGYRYISEEVEVLQILIDKAAQHFKSTTISSDDLLDGQKVLKGCWSVLEDLNSLFEKYKRRASINQRIAFMGVKIGEENIISLQERLIFNTGLLHGFVRRYVQVFYRRNPRIRTFPSQLQKQGYSEFMGSHKIWVRLYVVVFLIHKCFLTIWFFLKFLYAGFYGISSILWISMFLSQL